MSDVQAFAEALSVGYRTLLGYDGSSIDDAVEAALTPSGPSKDVLRARIEERRAA